MKIFFAFILTMSMAVANDYQHLVSQVRENLPFDPADKTYLFVQIVPSQGLFRKYDMVVLNGTQNPMNTALQDVGFKNPDFVVHGEQYLNNDEIYKLNQDLLILTTIGDRPMTKRYINRLINDRHSVWESQVPAFKNDRILYVDTTYIPHNDKKSLITALKYIAWHYGISVK